MPIFSKPKVIFWPKAKSVEIFQDKKENNTLSFDLNLWDKCTPADLQSLNTYFKQNKIDSCCLLVPDDVVSTKSFIYDTKITSIDKKEVIGLAESFVHFKIEPDSIEYNLIQNQDKTIIQATIFDKKKLNVLYSNLSQLSVKISTIKPVSASISQVIANFYDQEFFLLYPLNDHEYTLLLSKGDIVYLTSNHKGPSLDIQKIINYSNLYFTNPTNKIYIPQNSGLEIISTSQLDKTEYTEIQLAQKFGKASNIPLPVLGLLLPSNSKDAVIISNPQIPKASNLNKNMETKRNILPMIAVFIFTAALASVIIWFVLNRGSEGDIESPNSNLVSEVTPTVSIPTPTETPAPIVAEISKTIKIQVLNATDINGQAATLKEKLVALGFKNVAVGNSKEKADANQIRLKETMSSAEAFFESKMPDFPATFTTDLTETSTYDAVFVIGTDISGSEAAVASPTSKLTKTPTPTKKVTPTPEEDQ